MDVLLERDVSPSDTYDRLLAYAWVDGLMVNEEPVRLGWAVSKAYPPDTKYQKRLDWAEQSAQLARRGMWAAEMMPTSTPTARPVGRGGMVIADVDKEAEYFEVRNESERPVDVSRWRLLSVRGEQWYYFPRDTVLAPGQSIRVCSGPAALSCADESGGLFWAEEHFWNNKKEDDARLFNHLALLEDVWLDTSG